MAYATAWTTRVAGAGITRAVAPNALGDANNRNKPTANAMCHDRLLVHAGHPHSRDGPERVEVDQARVAMRGSVVER